MPSLLPPARLTFPVPGLSPLAGAALERARTWLDEAAVAARNATCHRSRCGTVIVAADDRPIGSGFNDFPAGCALDLCRKDLGLPAGFKSDRSCCQHAEVRAILDATRHHPDQVAGSTLYFTRLDPVGKRKISGAPYCTICSKMSLDVGVSFFVLEHPHGVISYPAGLYNDVSFAYGTTTTPA